MSELHDDTAATERARVAQHNQFMCAAITGLLADGFPTRDEAQRAYLIERAIQIADAALLDADA